MSYLNSNHQTSTQHGGGMAAEGAENARKRELDRQCDKKFYDYLADLEKIKLAKLEMAEKRKGSKY